MAIRAIGATGLIAFLITGFAAAPAAPPVTPALVRPVLIDFERDVGVWSNDSVFARDSLGIVAMKPDRCNPSRRVLYCFTIPGKAAGNATFDFARNSIEPVPVSPTTRVAWSWWVSRITDTNGMYIQFGARDRRTDRLIQLPAVHWLQNENDAFRKCWDPAGAWVYHEETVWNYLTTHFGDFAPGDLAIESVTLGMSQSPGMEARVDNIWIGDGPAPESIDVVTCEPPDLELESKPTGLSVGIFGLDGVPEIAVLYHERIEILDNRYEKSDEGIYREIRSLDKLRLRPPRGNGAASVLDIDNDGRADLLGHFRDGLGTLALSGEHAGKLRRMETDPVLAQLEQPMRGTTTADIDRDGLLDLALLHPYPQRHKFGGLRLVRNLGGWRFEDVTQSCGVPSEWAFGAAFGDVDGDFDADLFAGYRLFYDPDTSSGIERLYLNDGLGRFAPAGHPLPVPQNIFIEGGIFADFDGDADLDLYVVVSEVGGKLKKRVLPRNMLLLNDGAGRFSDASQSSGVDSPDSSVFAAAEDFDLDGDVDIFLVNAGEPSVLYWNDGAAHFEADTLKGIPYTKDISRAISTDLDADGDADMLLLVVGDEEPFVWENPTRGRGVSVSLWCTGNNRFGIGSKIYVYEAGHLDDPSHLIGYREMSIASGFGTYRPPVCQIGLGGRASADMRVIFPPVGGRELLMATKLGVPAGSAVTLCEYGGLAARVFENRHLYAARWRIQHGLFLVPAWTFGLLALALAGTLGFLARTSVAASKIPWRMILLLAAAAAAGALAFDRSFLWGAAFVPIFGAAYFLAPDIESTVRRRIDRAGRSELESHLLESVFKMRHCSGEYQILETLYNVDRRGAFDSKEARGGLDRLYALTCSMRRYAPDSANWRLARKEVLRMKRALFELERSKGDSERAKTTLHEAIGALSRVLGDFREELRLGILVRFMERWNALARAKAAELEAAGIALETEFAPAVEDVSLHLSEEDLRFIFDNLFVNSIHVLSGAPEKRIRVEGAIAGGHLVIQWLDSGPGIEPALQETLFKRPVVSSRAGGSGRGLHETARILKYKDGSIWLESPPRPGWGAHFVVKLLVTKG